MLKCNLTKDINAKCVSLLQSYTSYRSMIPNSFSVTIPGHSETVLNMSIAVTVLKAQETVENKTTNMDRGEVKHKEGGEHAIR